MRRFETPDAIWGQFTDDDPKGMIYPPISDAISDNDKVLAEIEFYTLIELDGLGNNCS